MQESYARRGYAAPERDYGDGYGDGGYGERGYAPERGYGDGGYGERGYAPERGYGDGGYGERGYAPGRGERGYAPERRSRGRGSAPERRSRERASATGAEKSTRTGGVILGSIAIFCTFMVLWGLYYATGTTERHKVALAAAECEPNLTSNNTPCVTVPMLVSEYASMTKPAIQQLNADVALYATNESHDLAAAKAALSAEVTTADELLTSLAKFPFPPFAAPEATATTDAIQARVKLMTKQARSSSLTQLRSFNARVNADAAIIRTDLKRLSQAVAHHPTPSQEPANVVGG